MSGNTMNTDTFERLTSTSGHWRPLPKWTGEPSMAPPPPASRWDAHISTSLNSFSSQIKLFNDVTKTSPSHSCASPDRPIKFIVSTLPPATLKPLRHSMPIYFGERTECSRGREVWFHPGGYNHILNRLLRYSSKDCDAEN